MGALKAGMTHAEAAEHLRREVVGTLRYESEGAGGLSAARRFHSCKVTPAGFEPAI